MDQDGDILRDLDAPIVSFRLFALERCIQEGRSPRLLDALERRRPAEADEECLLLLGYAIEAVRNRVNVSPAADAAAFREESFRAETSSRKLAFLSGLDRARRQELSGTAEEWVRREDDPIVGALLIRTFAEAWSPVFLEELSGMLTSDRLSIRMAALEVLVQRNPQVLARSLPALLLNRDPRTRALGIKGLAQLDLDEAVAHFTHLLCEGDLNQTIAALRIAVFLPFERIRTALLQFMAAESDLFLLEKAGLLFQNNPDQEVPWRLWEICEVSGAGKADLLREIIRGTCQNLKDSGILREELPVFFQRLNLWIRQRSLKRFLQDIAGQLETSSTSTRAAWTARLLALAQKPENVPVLRNALSWPIADAARRFFEQVLENATEKPDGEATPEFASLSPDEKIRRVSAWPEAKRAEFTAFAEPLMREGADPDLRAACLKTALRLNLGAFLPQARLVMNHAQPNLLAVVIEYLAVFDPDFFLTQTKTFLGHPETRVRCETIRALQRMNHSQGMAALRHLVQQTPADQLPAILPCMVYFDFVLVRPLLVELLIKTPSPKLLASGLCFFLANLEKENLPVLLELEKRVAPEFSGQIRKARITLEQMLLEANRLDNPDIERLHQQFETDWRKRTQREQRPPEPYAYEVLREMLTGTAARENAFSWIMESLTPRSLLWVGAMVFGFLLFLAWPAPEPPMARGARTFLAIPVAVTGTIAEVRKDRLSLTLVDDENVTFLALSHQKLGPEFSPGKRVKIRIIPFRKTGEGIIVATIQAVEGEL